MKKCLKILCMSCMIIFVPGCFSDTGGTVTDQQGGDPLLSGIEISHGSLDPAFSPEETSYTAAVSHEVESVTVTVRCESADILISVNGAAVEPGEPSEAVLLDAEGRDITISVQGTSGSISYIIQVKREQENLVSNPSFESLSGGGPDNWTLISSGVFVSEENPSSCDGFRAGCFTDLTSVISGREVRSDPFPVLYGSPLAVSARFLTSLDPQRTRVSLKVWFYGDEDGTMETGSPGAASVHLASSGTWEEIRCDSAAVDIPEGTVSARVSIRVMYDSDGGGTSDDRVWIDMVSAQIPGNLVLNHSFEELSGSAPESWEMISTGSCVSVDLADAPDGMRVLSFDRLTSSIAGREAVSAPFAVRAGMHLSVCARIRASRGGGVCRAAFRIYYFQDIECGVPSALNEYDSMNSVAVGSDTDWELMSWSRDGETVPEDAAFARIALRAGYDSDSGGTAGDNVYFDCMLVTQP